MYFFSCSFPPQLSEAVSASARFPRSTCGGGVTCVYPVMNFILDAEASSMIEKNTFIGYNCELFKAL